MTLAQRIAAIMEADLEMPYSRRHLIPPTAEKIAWLFNREEVMPTDARTPGPKLFDTPPPSARSQAGAFVPSEAQREEMARRLFSARTKCIAPHYDVLADYQKAAWLTEADAAFAYAQECGAIGARGCSLCFARAEEPCQKSPTSPFVCKREEGALSPAEPPAASIETIVEIISARQGRPISDEGWHYDAAREIAALRPVPTATVEAIARIICARWPDGVCVTDGEIEKQGRDRCNADNCAPYAIAREIAALRPAPTVPEALTVPEVWSQEERDGMAAAFSAADSKHGHYETLFAVAAWLLRHRAAKYARTQPTAPQAALPPALVKKAREIAARFASPEWFNKSGYTHDTREAVAFVRDLAALR